MNEIIDGIKNGKVGKIGLVAILGYAGIELAKKAIEAIVELSKAEA